jgi:hypothetical protein
MVLGLGLAMRCGLRDDFLERYLKRHAEFRSDWARGADEANTARQSHLMDLVRRGCELDKIEVPRERGEMIRAAVSGGSVTNIFTTGVTLLIQMSYDDEIDTTTVFAEEIDVDNFKTINSVNFSGGASLKPLARGGTAQHASPSDSKETYHLARYAQQISIDEMDLIDDEAGALRSMSNEFGSAAKRLRPDLVYSILLENPTMSDTGALFNSTVVTTPGGHANYAASGSDVLGGALSVNSLQLALTAMAKQTTPSGQAANIRGKALIVPAELRFNAANLINSATLILAGGSNLTTMGSANALASEQIVMASDGRIGPVGVLDPRDGKTRRTGSATNYFISAAPGRGVQVAYRSNTNRQPVIRSFALERGQWGMGWDINLDIGVCPTDYRGLFKAKGAA